ncbi:hypothetical protein K402DRAFT_385981 [Aulographum hederae CBS 113979]|uniref:Malic enzyme n=1 Tax=Aulographum hederae CBS 113979 TaxID=1176131 RepID=A0A6G1GL40_9PEZI|nr:hypothetical protein K402DRAFT_385981 [Aulographum hederae CBS 113979]
MSPSPSPIPTHLTGLSLLHNPTLNKGSAFPPSERTRFELHGLLPQRVQTLEQQVERAYQQFVGKESDIAKNVFLTSLREQDEVLFYALVLEHLKEMFSIIYTPTEGEAIENYSKIFRRPEGCFLNIEDQGRIETDLSKWASPDQVDIIVVSDGEQILGIGDQGVGAILISIAKLMIYTLCVGIDPSRTLPVVLDVGTNNKDHLNDPLYLGLQKPRESGEKYDVFVERFVKAAKKCYPNAYIHFEDFGLNNAKRILDKYSPQIACFNDDVQGTGCVTLAGVMAALRVSKVPMEELRLVAFGAGSAGTGIADQIKDAIAVESGKSKEEAAKQIWCVDKPGLILKSKKDQLTPAQLSFAREDSEWKDKDHSDLLSIIKEVKPHLLIGTSTQPGAFTREIVQEMASHVERPIIFPLSNPTRLHEAHPKDLIEWTDGKALVATGSPFDPVEYKGTTYSISECNNSTTFPGIGLGVILCKAKRVAESMLVAAIKALAEQAPALKDEDGAKGLLPDVNDVRAVSVEIAAAVIRAAQKEEVAGIGEDEVPGDDEELKKWIRGRMWQARYRPLVKAE